MNLTPKHLVKFSQDLMEVIGNFKEEMEILADGELVEQIEKSEENSRIRKTKVFTPEELKSELGL